MKKLYSVIVNSVIVNVDFFIKEAEGIRKPERGK